MAAPESLNLVRTRIGLQIAVIETRAARLKPVDICARMAAIRACVSRMDETPHGDRAADREPVRAALVRLH